MHGEAQERDSGGSSPEAKPAQRTRDLWGGDDIAGDYAEGAPCMLGGRRLVPPLLLDIPGRVYEPPPDTPTPRSRQLAQRMRDLMRPLSVRRLGSAGPASARNARPSSARHAKLSCHADSPALASPRPPSAGLLCGLLPRSARLPTEADEAEVAAMLAELSPQGGSPRGGGGATKEEASSVPVSAAAAAGACFR
ncbi:hypothetical protein WJX81_003993 [Elliptochloris bilobata]|uniref:Uncharacterized protein n=1 Tax=Elliptochloris bilobata TaxID=381761 RepID=A0AAW1QIG0_9CHLO